MVLKLRNSGGGIGDQICGLYVCQALKEKYPFATIEYYSKYPEWLVDIDNIVLKPYSHYFLNPPAKIDLYVDSSTRTYYRKKKESRKQIYLNQIGFGKLYPTPPKLKRIYQFKQSYISLFPFSAWKNREWPLEKWISLEHTLKNSGYKTLILGQGNRKSEIEKFSGKKVIDTSVGEVIDLMLNSSLVVANDSGMAHLAGMYNVPAISVLSGKFSRNHLFSETEVLGISPDNSRQSLDSIEPNKVYGEIVKLINHHVKTSKLFGTITLI